MIHLNNEIDHVKENIEMSEQESRTNACEYRPTQTRRLAYHLTKDQIRYTQLWVELESPKLLKEKEMKQ